MSEVSDRYARVADGFGARLAGVGTGQWASPTPCAEWDVRTLVDHVIDTHGRVVASIPDSSPDEREPVGDPMARWRVASDRVRACLDDPLRASATMTSSAFGEQSFESLVGRLLCADTLFHTWDLARATGQDERLDPDAVDKAMAFLEPIDEAIRRPGGFAARLPTPSDADPQTRLLLFGGRPTA